MLTIRLTRKGKKNQPFFRIVVIDKRRSSKGGRAVEVLGYVNPLTKKHSLEKERILHWLNVGAQPSPRMHNLLVAEKIINEKKIKVFGAKKGKGASAASASPVAPVSQEIPAPEAKPEASALEVKAESPVSEPEKPTV